MKLATMISCLAALVAGTVAILTVRADSTGRPVGDATSFRT